jgi:hypothetical protein
MHFYLKKQKKQKRNIVCTSNTLLNVVHTRNKIVYH